MARTPRTTKEVNAVKETILKRAMQTIVAEGYFGLTMRKLAAELNMTAANIYNYFSSKEEIFLRLSIEGYEILQTYLRNGKEGSRMERARAFMLNFVRFGIDQKDYYQLMFVMPTPHYTDFVGTPLQQIAEIERETSLSLMQDAYELLRELLPGVEERIIRVRVAEVWSFLHGLVTLQHRSLLPYIVQYKETETRKSLEQITEDFLAVMVRSMSKEIQEK